MLNPADKFRPAVDTPLGDWDNYQIYSLVAACVADLNRIGYSAGQTSENWYASSVRAVSLQFAENFYSNNTEVGATRSGPEVYIRQNNNGSGVSGWLVPSFYGGSIASSYPSYSSPSVVPALVRRLYAIQSFAPKGVDVSKLQAVMDNYPIKTGVGFKAEVYNYPTEAIEWAAPVSPFSWENLAVYGRVTFSAIATVDGMLTYNYWAVNSLEQHPLIDLTLDYRSERVYLKKGKPFKIQLNHPIAQTLTLSNQSLITSLAESGSVVGSRPNGLSEYLATSTAYADRLRSQMPALPPTPQPTIPPFADRLTLAYWTKYLPNNNGSVGGYELQLDGVKVSFNTAYTYGYSTFAAGSLIYQQLPANNDCWQTSSGLMTYPLINLNITPLPVLPSGTTSDSLYYQLQPDGTYGSLAMDSPRILEIYDRIQGIFDAFDIGTYSKDPDTNAPRTANLGHFIERIAAMLGYRPRPDGTMDLETERTTYARRPSSPSMTKNDYGPGRFGRKGLLFNRLPNRKTAAGYQNGGRVAVHDLPQMLSEILDQLNQALNIQESTSIQVRDGDNTYTYPNQLALLTEMGTAMIQMRRQTREIWGSSIVTQNSVNEVIAGIGLPTVAKTIAVNGQPVPYWGIRPDRSITKEIAAVNQTAGTVLGQLL
jgi:hypothetical protein